MPFARFQLGMMLAVAGALSVSAQPRVTSALNAADFSAGLAPGAEVSFFGSGFTTTTVAAAGVPLPNTLGGVSVQVSDGSTTALAPLFYVSPQQINAQLPYGLQGILSVTVTTGAGQSAPLSFTVAANAPKFFTLSQDGTGFILATHADNTMVSNTAPVRPGEAIILYLNSLGAVNPPVAAGQAPGNGTSAPLNRVVAPTSVTLDSFTSAVTYAGLAPGFPGLYQVSFTAPYDDKLGDAAITVTTGSASTQSAVTVPVRSNGLYWEVTAGKFVNGQTFTGMPGTNGDVAVRHNDAQAFGANGFNAWSKFTGFSSTFAPVAGVALTLRTGNNIVFDNNGIETGTTGSYYASAPGFDVLFAMSSLSSPTNPSNTVQGVYSGYFRLTAATAFDQMLGYFEGPENVDPPFDPANIYNTFHMNVFSSVSGAPKETGSFTGDVFTSNSTAGSFSYSRTAADRVGADGTHFPIYRLVYTLRAPLTLPAGEYWFAHDVSTPSFPSASTSTEEPQAYRSVRPRSGVKSFGAPTGGLTGAERVRGTSW